MVAACGAATTGTHGVLTGRRPCVSHVYAPNAVRPWRSPVTNRTRCSFPTSSEDSCSGTAADLLKHLARRGSQVRSTSGRTLVLVRQDQCATRVPRVTPHTRPSLLHARRQRPIRGADGRPCSPQAVTRFWGLMGATGIRRCRSARPPPPIRDRRGWSEGGYRERHRCRGLIHPRSSVYASTSLHSTPHGGLPLTDGRRVRTAHHHGA